MPHALRCLRTHHLWRHKSFRQQAHIQPISARRDGVLEILVKFAQRGYPSCRVFWCGRNFDDGTGKEATSSGLNYFKGGCRTTFKVAFHMPFAYLCLESYCEDMYLRMCWN